MNLKTRSESQEHQNVKSIIAKFFSDRGAPFVAIEVANSDVLVIWKGQEMPVEYERSARNVIRNTTRNFDNGASKVLVVVPDFEVMGSVARTLQRKLDKEFHEKVAVITLNALDFLEK